MARGSVYELSTQCEICMRLSMPGEWGIVVENCEEIGRILNGLMASIRKTMS
jgi:four helix bundle protein